MSMPIRMTIWKGLVLAAFFLFVSAVTKSQTEPSSIPKGGFVPDRETAIRIAEAVWIPLYGEARISQEKPFVAELHDGVWTVSGTFHSEAGTTRKGGVATIKISKLDGRIIMASHGK
jgi:hypothetical protein